MSPALLSEKVARTVMQDIPALGLGTWLSPDDAVTTEAVRYAIEEAGYRHIDCAAAYGNEQCVGAALADLFSRGVVKREEVWITSKLWCQEFDPADVERACRESLRKLQLDYLDLYLIHWPFKVERREGDFFPMRGPNEFAIVPNDIVETYKAVQKLVELKLVRHIGVSNFSIALLEKIRFAEGIHIQPYTNQVEMHLYMQNEALIRYCEFRGMKVTGWGCLGRGASKKGGVVVLEDPVLNEVAKEIGRPVASVLIRFQQQLSPCVSVLAKSVTKERIKSNNELDFTLNEDQMTRLRKRERCLRLTNRLEKWGIDVFADEF